MRLHHRFDGPDSAPVLVFSNSIGTTLELWNAQVPAFAGPFRMLRYDQLGHGRSDVPPGPYTVELLGRELLGLLDELGIGRFSFCGLSLGGAVGMWLGANAADRLDRLVLAATSAYFGPPERWIGCFFLVLTGPASSTGTPTTFRMRPSTSAPTGIEIGALVFLTG